MDYSTLFVASIASTVVAVIIQSIACCCYCCYNSCTDDIDKLVVVVAAAAAIVRYTSQLVGSCNNFVAAAAVSIKMDLELLIAAAELLQGDWMRSRDYSDDYSRD